MEDASRSVRGGLARHRVAAHKKRPPFDTIWAPVSEAALQGYLQEEPWVSELAKETDQVNITFVPSSHAELYPHSERWSSGRRLRVT